MAVAGEFEVRWTRVALLAGRRLALILCAGAATAIAVTAPWGSGGGTGPDPIAGRFGSSDDTALVPAGTVASATGIPSTDIPSTGASAADPLTGAERAAVSALVEAATMRVEAAGCDGVVAGSGFAVGGRVLTNAHVVGPADSLRVRGRAGAHSLKVLPLATRIDLAAAGGHRGTELVFADVAPDVGDPVMFAGFGGGRELTVAEASVHGYTDGGAYGIEGTVLMLDRPTTRGFSGGPVLDRRGRVVGMLQAFDTVTGLTLAIPVEALDDALGAEVVAGAGRAEAPPGVGGC